MWIERNYQTTLQKLIKEFPSLVLTGPRQVGKTSTLLKLFPKYNYISLDLPYNAAQAEESPENFLDRHGDQLIIDEVQYAPSILRYLKYRIDRDRTPGKYLLTGSQHFSLMDNISDSLAGRCGVINMLGFSAAELKKSSNSWDEFEFIWKGGMPELYARPEITPEYWHTSYLATYLERDVRNIINVGNLRDFDKFLRACCIRIGQLLSLSDLAKDVGISPNTAKNWLSVLQTSGQIILLEPYYRSLGKRITKSPKLYFTDTGIAAFMLGFETPDSLFTSHLAGQFWENHVVLELFKLFYEAGKQPRMWFWRTGSGDEVDLVVERGEQVLAIESTFSEHPGEKDIRGLKHFIGQIKGKVQGLVACRTPSVYPLSSDIDAIPAQNLSHYF